MQTAVSRAAAGARVLDTKIPDWAKKVDVSRLDIGDTENCILGQIFGDYNDGQTKLGFFNRFRMTPLGFMPKTRSGFGEFQTDAENLTNAWKAEIAKRVTA
jgi:hypothetical protein